jgi:hypothetical protein
MRRQKRSLIRLHAAAMASRMPVLRYFLYIGGVLFGLLFILDAYLPTPPMPARVHNNMPVIRIASDRKWPERVVYDTNLPTIVPAPSVTIEARLPIPAKDAGASATIRQAFAELQSSEAHQPRRFDAKNREADRPRERKITKRRAAPKTVLVLRQPQFSWFGTNTW